MKRKTIDDFVSDSKKVHGNKYDYSKVEYINNKTKVCIICPEHGEFWQAPQDHTKGRGCVKCNGGISYTNEEWMEKFYKTHGEKYKYETYDKLSSNTKIKITCPTHGVFIQSCMNHSLGQGCPKCANEESSIKRRNTTELFIKLARKIHGDKYDYSKVEYINNHKEVCIICHKHGEFYQKPNVHLLNHGCPKCSSSKLELELIKCFDENNIKYIHQTNKKIFNWLNKMSLDFYLPDYNTAIECQGLEHFKEIEFFGGVKNFNNTIKRDKLKLELCNKNGINLLYYSNLGIEYPYKVFENKENLIYEIKNGKK